MAERWTFGDRQQAWEVLQHQTWDVLVIGGGITGAGILRQCAQAGLQAALVEAHDFASGASSRSSKLVHGGLRYLKNAQIRVTLESVRERERLLRQGRGLIQRLGFLYACLEGDPLPGWMFGLGLVVYDLMAGQWSHRAYKVEDLRELCPPLSTPRLRGGYRYFDALTDDARLVLRLVREAVEDGALALNYAQATTFLRTHNGHVCGAVVEDTSGESQRRVEVTARLVINATGAWADGLRELLGRPARLRPLRGSHLVLPFDRLPLRRAISFLHPRDGRPVFTIPWEGVVLFGTTDVDHRQPPQTDPTVSSAESDYLLEALQAAFPAQALEARDVLCVYAGLRPVVNTGQANPSKESREHVIWEEDGLLTVSGGKLTTFRIMARQALWAVRRRLGAVSYPPNAPILNPLPAEAEIEALSRVLPASHRLRWLARYGPRPFEQEMAPADLEPIPFTPYLWAELRQAARAEAVVHLDDLLLRRLRLGLLLPRGGLDLLPHIRPRIQDVLGWEDARWDAEAAAYADLWERAYRLGGHAS